MAGTLLSVLEMTSYTFTGLGNAAEASQLIAANVDVTRWSQGTLQVRVHSNGIASGAHLYVRVRPVLPSPQDPTRKFEGTTDLAEVDIVNATVAPSLEMDAFSTPIGSYVNVYVEPKQNATAVALVATISVDLVLKD